jgi:hypothetical protein
MSTVETGSHEGAVGEVVFQQRTDKFTCTCTRARSEAVVSVATAGRVTQWTVVKGLEPKDLVILKQLRLLGSDGETRTLRYEDLHCISFSFVQPNVSVPGREDGALFVCDTHYMRDIEAPVSFSQCARPQALTNLPELVFVRDLRWIRRDLEHRMERPVADLLYSFLDALLGRGMPGLGHFDGFS